MKANDTLIIVSAILAIVIVISVFGGCATCGANAGYVNEGMTTSGGTTKGGATSSEMRKMMAAQLSPSQALAALTIQQQLH